MARYSASASCLNTSGLGMLGIVSTAAVRPKVYDIIIGSRASPLDNTCTYDVARSTTAAPTAATVVRNPLDPLTTAAVATAFSNANTPAPTKGLILLSVSLNMRATFRWVAAPGSELISTNVATEGIFIWGLTPTTAYVCEATMLWEE